MIAQHAFIGLIVVVLLHTANVGAKHGRHQHSDGSQQPPSALVDAFGNCFMANRQRHGRCELFHLCPTAVAAWQTFGTHPEPCYHTNYGNFVCCPHDNQQSLTQITYSTVPAYDLNRTDNHVSQKECAATYKKKQHRSKRETCAELGDCIDGGSDDHKPGVVEEVIQKKTVLQTAAVGGVPTSREEFPYMCALGWTTSSHLTEKIAYNCGCVLIAKKFVLTAAHCSSFGGEPPFVVRLGGADLDEKRAETIKIKKIIQHPQYDAASFYNDIAIIKLAKKSRKHPACIWPVEVVPQQQLIATGYGRTQFAGSTSKSLLKVTLNVISNQACNESYKSQQKLPYGIGAGQICAGDPQGNMDTCQGDSGGPLLMKLPSGDTVIPYVVGLTSFGQGCANGRPSVYTRLSNYIDWIEQVVW